MLQASIGSNVLHGPCQFPIAQRAQQVPGEDHALTATLGQPLLGQEVGALLQGLFGVTAKAQIAQPFAAADQLLIQPGRADDAGLSFTYIRTYEGWLYLAVVLDLFSRQIIGWSMKSQMTSDVAIDALLMAVWRRKPKQEVMIHSDQGSQYSSSDWRSFLKANNLVASMSRRGNCHDNAVAESFFQLLKRERIKRKIYTTRQDARDDVFDYIEMFYNPKRRHSFNNQLSPVEFEKRYAASLESV